MPEGLKAKEGCSYDDNNLPKAVVHEKTGIEMVLVGAGSFRVNDPFARAKLKKISIKTPFYIGKYEVTVGQFKKFTEQSRYKTDAEKTGARVRIKGEWESKPDANWKKPYFEQTDDHPVVYVNRNDANAFCEWAGLSLPTESQWEYACRAGTKTDYYFGKNITHNDANYSGTDDNDKWEFTSPVGSFPPNPWMLYEMAGNVFEWCSDWYYKDYYLKKAKINPNQWKDNVSVSKGGSWFTSEYDTRSNSRMIFSSDSKTSFVGFRVAKELDKSK